MSLVIRKAQLKDLRAITDIYNEAILTTDATFDTGQKSLAEQKAWFDDHGPRNPVLVAVVDGKVCGWASLSKWSTRCAYEDTVEISVYVGQEYRGCGIGKKLMQEVLAAGDKTGLHAVISRITSGNTVSIRLHEQLGFEHIGVMKEVGKKFGRMLDVCMMQKIYHKVTNHIENSEED
jgi:phosphinothricin acetyltransferase